MQAMSYSVTNNADQHLGREVGKVTCLALPAFEANVGCVT
jgi:hypothetical protein